MNVLPKRLCLKWIRVNRVLDKPTDFKPEVVPGSHFGIGARGMRAPVSRLSRGLANLSCEGQCDSAHCSLFAPSGWQLISGADSVNKDSFLKSIALGWTKETKSNEKSQGKWDGHYQHRGYECLTMFTNRYALESWRTCVISRKSKRGKHLCLW